MDDETVTGARGIRWWRALGASVLAEVALVAVAVPFFTTMADPTPTLNWVIPPASGVLFVVAGYWAARPVPRSGVIQGALTGLIAVVLYLGIGMAGVAFTGEARMADALTPAYLAAHGLKIVGGALGGWLAARRGAR